MRQLIQERGDVGGVVNILVRQIKGDDLASSVSMMLRQSPAGSLPLKAEVETSHGYAPYH